MPKKVFIKNWGCQMNVRDSEVISGMLAKEGFRIVPDESRADVVIYNTCSVRKHAEDKVWSELGKFKKKSAVHSPQSTEKNLWTMDHRLWTKPIIGLVGCMAQNYQDEVFQRAPEVDFVVGPGDIHKIPGIIAKFIACEKDIASSKSQTCNDTAGRKDNILLVRKIWETGGEARPEEIYHTGFYEDKGHAYVVISEGCDNSCSYCVVPYVRGRLRSRNYKDILREVGEAVEKGINSITLLGQNVNSYRFSGKEEIASQKALAMTRTTHCHCEERSGCEAKPKQTRSLRAGIPSRFASSFAPLRTTLAVGTGCAISLAMTNGINFIELLRKVNAVKGLKEFSFITSHPKDTTVDLFKAMRDLEKLKKYLHLPVQSGSDRILGLMNRGYSRGFYRDLIRDYRDAVKGGVLTTDVIVGFPGETEEDFQDTYSLVKEAQFDSAYIFKYSPRPHTKAEGLPDDVPRKEKERRHGLVLNLQKEISRRKRLND